MECHDARLLLTLHRRDPDQFDSAELEAIERHVELCPGCQNWNRSDVCFETAVTSALKKVAVPADLKQRIDARLSASRPPRRMAWAAVAAAVMLMLGAGGVYYWTRPALVDFDEFVFLVDEPQAVSPRSVQTYFAEMGYSMTPPPEFKYEYLIDYKLVRYDGRFVPMLTFQRDERNGTCVKATVYCLSKSQFRISADADIPSSLRVFEGDNDMYVVHCAGGDLWLLRHATY